MQIVITGGAGFLGVRLARTLLAQGQLSLAGAAPPNASTHNTPSSARFKSHPVC